MKGAIARSLAGMILRRPATVAIVILCLAALCAWRVSRLQINHNQIDLIPQDLPEVVATKDMINMVGAVGFLLVPLKHPDLATLKKVADDIAPRLVALQEIRKVTYKQDVDFVRDRIALYVQTPDLKKAYKRIRKKIRAILAKNNPFHIALTEVKDEPLDLDDLIEKYRRMNKKAVDDPYYVDLNRESILMVIKPDGLVTDLEFIRGMLASVEGVFADYSAQNPHGVKLVEYYGEGFSPGGEVSYGYTGGYKRSVDDSDTIRAAIIPTMFFAGLGIFLYLLWVLRRPTQILIIMATLAMSVTMAFAFCELVIGELNIITAMMAAILMGLGIDYGIHFMFRFREEYTRTQNLEASIERTLERSGPASLGAALTTAAALYVLTLSDFRGFAHFGLVAGTGVLLAFVSMYATIPTLYVLANRVWPAFKEGLETRLKDPDYEALAKKRFPMARGVLLATAAITLGLVFFATQIEFDYDSRAIMSVDRPSRVLQDEITKRWEMSSDPVGVYTPTLDEARALFEHLTPIPEASGIDSVISLFLVVPPMEQQQANRKILDKLERRAQQIDKGLIEDPKLLEHYDTFLRLLAAQPFTLKDLPSHIERQFRPVSSSRFDGYLTFIYPKTGLWDGRELLAFAHEVGEIKVNGDTYYSAGVAVLFARLAEIVLGDGLRLTLLAALAIFFIAWIDFRSIRGALLAMLPLCAGVVWMLGLMALTSWRINFINIVVFPLVFGYGISAGVHLYHRYMESGSVMVAVRRTGGAIKASSITTLVGWASLLISNHRGLESMGILACFGIASTLLVSLTVLPALLQVLGRYSRAPRLAAGTAGEQPVSKAT